jgi:uncharacterized protein YbgA (DUF1722 family)
VADDLVTEDVEHLGMNQSLLTTLIEKYRGRSIALLVNRWQQRVWERRLEKATKDAQRLVEEYRRGEKPVGRRR